MTKKVSLPRLLITPGREATEAELLEYGKAWLNEIAEVISLEAPLAIERVRELVMQLAYSAVKPRLILIPQLEQASLEAQQALLKTLEEPPANSYFVLGTRSSEGILATIRSRVLEVIKPSKKSSDQPEATLVSAWEEVLGADPGRAMQLVEQFTTRQTARAQIEAWLQLVANHDFSSARAGRLASLALALRQLDDNVNVKLALGSLFLTLCGHPPAPSRR